MASKPKLWILADENDQVRVYRFEDRENAEIWMEIRLDKGT
jgi:hypothetical protein